MQRSQHGPWHWLSDTRIFQGWWNSFQWNWFSHVFRCDARCTKQHVHEIRRWNQNIEWLEFFGKTFSLKNNIPKNVLNFQCSIFVFTKYICILHIQLSSSGPRQANLLLIAYASSEGSGEPAHPRSLARTFAARSYKQWIKRNLQTESQIRGPSEWLGMRGWNLSWRNARRHKFAWRGSSY